MMTEINMNVAAYVKFDSIANAVLDKQQLLLQAQQNQPSESTGSTNNRLELDASFNVDEALNLAIQRLSGNRLDQPQSTPALGEYWWWQSNLI